jgi:hypothetical protein
MTTSEIDEKIEDRKKKDEKTEEGLPFCTTAPSAEHTRAEEAEGPCDDYRSGDYDK